MGRQVTVCANPFLLFREPCQPAGVLGLSVVRQQEQRLFRGRPLRQADHRIQIALKSAPRAMGKTLVSAPSARIRLGRLATAVQTQDALPVARLVILNTISFPWLQGKQLGQPPDFSMISPPELQPATTMTLEIDPQVRYQQNPSEAAQHAAVRAMVDYVVAAASWAAVMDKTSLLESPKAPR
jgi:hypothetical protein